MKTFLTTAVILCLAITAIVIYTNAKTTPVAAAPPAVTEAAPAPAATPQINIPAVKASVPVVSTTNHVRHHNAPRAADASASNKPNTPAAFQPSLDILVSRQSSFQDRQAAWKQLHESGQFDRALEALRQGAKENPDSPEYAAMLGQALLQKAGEVSKNGGSMNELGILGMQADQSFDNALKNDPSNWDAQFFKAVSMSYWPAELNKGNEVVERLSTLINQQDTMPSQSQFSLPYIKLGDQYQKLGQTDNALQTWQAGAARFPNDTTLQQKLTAATQH